MVLALVFFATLPAGATAQTSGEDEARQEMERARAERWAKASDRLLVAPYFTIAQGMSSSLILVNRFAEPLDLTLAAHGPGGGTYSLGTHRLAARETAEISLNERLQGTPADFTAGSLRASYFGDDEMIQAWLVLSGSRGSLELPLWKLNATGPSQWRSFWDTRPYHPGEQIHPRFVFHNAQATPVVVNLSLRPLAGPSETRRISITAGGTSDLKLKAHGRWVAASLEVRHDGEPGQVAFTGLLEGRRFLAPLPVASPGHLDAAAFESFALPLDTTPDAHGNGRSSVLSLFNPDPTGTAARVRISLLDASGTSLAEWVEVLEPGEIDSTALPAVSSHQTAAPPPRLTLAVEVGQILPFAVALADDGTAIDVALIPREKAHDSGTYPLPSLLEHDVSTAFLNLGAEPEEVLAHIAWEDGGYAITPFTVPPGGSYRLDFNALAAAGRPDLLGRSFPGDHRFAFFQWLAKSGRAALVARTEVRRKGDQDRIGFNCFGCCEQVPYGALIPDDIAFDIGQTPSLDPVIYYSTCSGTVGPYTANPDVLSYSAPLSWDGSTISSTDYTSQTVSFSEGISYTWVDCSERTKTVRAAGPAVVDRCAKEHNPDYNPAAPGGCHAAENASTCTDCFSCCEKEKAVANCRCQRIGQDCRAAAQHGCEKCKQACIGHFLDECTEQSYTCAL